MDAAMRVMKTRFALLVKLTGEGTAADFARAMNRQGYDIDDSTVKRWTKLDNPTSPNLSDLWVIHLVKPEISIDWLMGLRPPESADERWIEAQAVVQHEYIRLSRLSKAAKLGLVLLFIYGGAACAIRQVEVQESRTSWVQVVSKLWMANSVEPVDFAYVKETLAGQMLPKWNATVGKTIRWPQRPSVDLRLRGKWK